MKKFFILFIIFSFLFFKSKDFSVLCKMSKGEKCSCAGEHSKHSCCKIIKIQKDLNIDFKTPKINFPFLFFNLNENLKEKIELSFFKENKVLNIHSPPVFLKNLNLLI